MLINTSKLIDQSNDRAALTRDSQLADLVNSLDDAVQTIATMQSDLVERGGDADGSAIGDAFHVIEEAANFIDDFRHSLHKMA
jgi:hypothetical protein